MAAPSYTSEPQFLSIRKLLEDVRGGHILVPRFQRPFVWTDEQRLELLRSIKEQNPIGSVLVWRTSRTDLACYPNIGPYAVVAPDLAPGADRTYLLDGHQRLSTLYGLLTRGAGNDGDPEIDWDIQYDLDAEDFVFTRRSRGSPPLLPLYMLLDSREIAKFSRRLDAHFTKVEESIRQQWLDRADQLAYTFQEFRIPVVPMTTPDLDQATRTFQRINSQGTTMSEVHMVAALTWTEQFDLLQYIQDNVAEHLAPQGWGDVEERTVLNTIKGIVGVDIAKADEGALTKRIRANPTVVEDAVIGLGRAATFLAHHCGVLAPEILPYQLQAVLLATALHHTPSPPSGVAAELARWFWLTTWWTSFASIGSQRVKAAAEHLQALAAGDQRPWPLPIPEGYEDLPRRFDFRSARAKAFVLWQCRLRENHRGGAAAAEAFKLIATYRNAAIGVLFYDRDIPAALRESAANRVLLAPSELIAFRKALRAGTLTADQLLDHHISRASASAAESGDVRAFLEERLDHLQQLDRQLYETLVPRGFNEGRPLLA